MWDLLKDVGFISAMWDLLCRIFAENDPRQYSFPLPFCEAPSVLGRVGFPNKGQGRLVSS